MNTITHDNQDYEIIPIQDAIIQSKLLEGSYLMRPVAAAPKRWRAEKDKIYYIVNTITIDNPVSCIVEERVEMGYDDIQYKLGNYFKTEEQAQAVVDAIKLVFEYVHNPVVVTSLGVTDDTSSMFIWDKLGKALDGARQKVQEEKTTNNG